MSEYLIVKWVHVLSSTILFGTGIGSAFYMLCAGLSRDPKVAHFVARYVVIADWLFTATAVVVQPLTGFWLAHLAGFSLGSRWIAWSIALYFVAGACWLPVVYIQIRMRDTARAAAAESRGALPARYWRLFRIWFALGIPAFASLVVVFWLMIAKPG
jgi:uncharacterized membrane protein